MGKTAVWIRGNVLAKALGKGEDSAKLKKKTSSIDLDRGGGQWGWFLCELIDGNISDLESASLTVKVFDDNSEFKGQTATIEPASGKGNGLKQVVMANEWAAAEVSGGNGELGPPPDDLITLTHLHEPAVVYCLRQRYEKDMIYTATGPILIALNPFKPLSELYDDVMMNEHWMAGEGVAELNLKPHIYQNAHAAFRSMMDGIEMLSSGMTAEDVFADQSMLVSGESGAGKTVTTKHVMKYLASLSQRKAEFNKRRRAASPGRSEPMGARRSMSMRASRSMSWKAGALVEERILESNPILEAFGNARTVRNDNSSRFGKFIELQFKKSGSLVGAKIETYLLEKVRLVHQSEGERNYHIFYELLAAATKEERETLKLGGYTVKDFKMTNSSGTFDRRDGEDDEELYDELMLAMATMGFEHETQNDILRCCSAFLHAFNLTFTAPTEESSKVDESNPHLQAVLELLGLESDAFNSAMTEYDIEIGNQTFTKQLTTEGAQKAIEAFIKGTYGAMFLYIVNTVNKRIDYKPSKGTPKLLGKAASISVLDIFGFESFQVNSFEQLCINYCNEALQQQFNRFVFKNEQEEYKKEGIAWETIDFPDNNEVIDLIEKKGTGLLSILTDQCRQPRTSDQTFLSAMYKACESNERFVVSALHKGKGQFIINHYAGLVMYESVGFIEKNKDETPRGASQLLESSSMPFVQLLGKITMDEDDSKTPSTPRSSKKRPTVGSQFSSQLTELRRRIDVTKPHYIRCLKPNQKLIADDFESAMVADQLRYSGVLEAIRVSRAGYSQRYSHAMFIERYRFIAAEMVRKAEADKALDILLGNIANSIWASENPGVVAPSDLNGAIGIQKGQTKVFLRQNAFEQVEKLRHSVLTGATVKIQAIIRSFVYRRRFKRTVRGIIMIQANIRRFLARMHLDGFRKRRAAVRLQAFARYALVQKEYRLKNAAAVLFQKVARARLARNQYNILHAKVKEERRIFKAARTIQCRFRVIAAKIILQHKKSIERTPSKTPAQLQGKALHAAIKADRAAAIAKESAQQRKQEVKNLTTKLADEHTAAEQGRTAVGELHLVTMQLEAALAELEKMKAEAAASTARVAKLEAENADLKSKLDSGTFVAETPYNSKVYSEFPELEDLDKQLYVMSARSKSGKKDLKQLLSSLSALT